LAELLAYPLVCLPPGTGVRNALDQACAAAGLRATIALEASAPGAVVDLGTRGLGVAVLSRSMAESYPGLSVVPIDGIDVRALLALVWRPRHTPAVKALLPHCRRAFGTEQQAP
jgi:DNA-binding transcriptional LysR family regulator